MEFMHIGVINHKERENENYAEGLKVFITDPEESEFKYEYLRFDEDSPMHEAIRTNPHVAFKVDDMTRYLHENEVLMEPFMAGENLKIAFIMKDGMVLEIMQEV